MNLFTCSNSFHTVYGCFCSVLLSFQKSSRHNNTMPAVKIHFIHLRHTNICVLCYGRNPSASTRFLLCCNLGGILSILYLCRFSATTALCDFGCSDTVSVIVFMISNYKLSRVYLFGLEKSSAFHYYRVYQSTAKITIADTK